MSLLILQCDTCPATFTLDRNPEVGVHWSRKEELLRKAREAGWLIENTHRCPACLQKARDRKRSE